VQTDLIKIEAAGESDEGGKVRAIVSQRGAVRLMPWALAMVCDPSAVL
jgi:hypothetical protein